MTTTNSQQRYLLSALFLITAIDTLGTSFVWPLFGPLFTGKSTILFAASVSMETKNILYGITIGIASLFTILGAPILGNLSDHIGRRKVLLLCLLGTSFGMTISALGIFFNQVIFLIISRAWLGAITASSAIAKATVVDIGPKENKASRLACISAANNIGFVFGPIISSILIDSSLVSWFNPTLPFYFAALLALLSAFLLIKAYKEPLKTEHQEKQSLKANFHLFVKAFTNKPIRAIAIIYLCLQVGWAIYLQTNFVILIQHHNYTSRLLGYFLSWLGVVYVFNLLIVVPLLIRFLSLRKIIFINMLIAAVCCTAIAIYDTKTAIWFSILPMTSAIALGANAIVTSLSNVAQTNEQGWAMGISKSLAAVAWAFAPPLTGIIIAFGFHIPLFLAAFLFLVGTTLAVIKLNSPHNQAK